MFIANNMFAAETSQIGELKEDKINPLTSA